jgi:hypothetical protein
MTDALKQFKGEPLASCGSGGEEFDGVPEIVLNRSKALARAISSMLKKPFRVAAGVPFVIKPTPNPELSDSDLEKIKTQLLDSVDMLTNLADIDPTLVDDATLHLKNTVLHDAELLSVRKAGKIQQRIADILLEAGFTNALFDLINHLSVQPFGVIKLETTVVKSPKWVGGRIVITDEVTKIVRSINPFDFYTSPRAKSVKLAPTTIERRTVTRSDLIDMIGAPGYWEDAILKVLETYPDGVHEPIDGDLEDDGSRDKGNFGLYDCLIMFDRIPASYLTTLGVAVEDAKMFYDVEVWTIGSFPISAELNTHPLGHRPYYGTSYSKSDTIYGDSPVTDVNQIQIILNALAKAIVRNAGLTSGFQGELDLSRIDKDDRDGERLDDLLIMRPNTIRPIPVPDRNQGQPAYKFYTLPFLGQQLMALVQAFSSYIYDVIGIPPMAFGAVDGMATAARSPTGVSMLLNQSVGTIKEALDNIEVDVIQPLVSDLLLDELLYGEDDDLKGDVKAYALGLSGLAEDDSKADKLPWLMQSLASIAGTANPDGSPIIPPDAMARVLFRAFKDAGVNTEGVFPDFDEMDALKQDAPSMGPVTQSSPVDGRTPQPAAAMVQQGGV